MVRRGWPREPRRHAMAARGIPSSRRTCVARGNVMPGQDRSAKPFQHLEMPLDDVVALLAWTHQDDGFIDVYPGFNFYDRYNPVVDYEYEEGEEYLFKTKEEAEEYAKSVVDIFNSLPNPIRVYRWIYLEEEDDFIPEDLGEFWTYHPTLTQAFGNTRLKGTIDTKDVDWRETLIRIGEWIGDENEIFIPDPSKVELKGVERYE